MDDTTFNTQFDSEYRAKYNAAPEGFAPLDMVSALGSIHGALLCSKLYLPEFIEIDGFVFLRDVVEDNGGEEGVRELIQQHESGHQIERRLNTFDLTLNLPNRLNESAIGDDSLLAEQLAVSWRLRLRGLYPTKSFMVTTYDEDGEVGFLFWQEPGSESVPA